MKYVIWAAASAIGTFFWLKAFDSLREKSIKKAIIRFVCAGGAYALMIINIF